MALSNSSKNIARALVSRPVRNWLRSPSASARWVWDNLRFSIGIKSVIQMRPGWFVTCHPSVYRCAYRAQNEDPEQIAEFDGFISKLSAGAMFLDIGAHFGLFSLAALHYGGSRARAVAIDPSPVAVSVLNLQAKLNRVTDRLQILQAAVSDQVGFQNLVAVGVLANGYYVMPSEDIPTTELTHVKSATIDGIVDELKIVPTHIKIDVEGHEAAVLRGARQLLSKGPAPILSIEIHNHIIRELGGDPTETISLLRSYRYETFMTDGQPITSDEILEKPLIRIVATKRVNASKVVS